MIINELRTATYKSILLLFPTTLKLKTVKNGVYSVIIQCFANRTLAELKGYVDTIPNKHILINAVIINEAKDSSAIEKIITTHDELYKAMSGTSYNNLVAKEVVSYRSALWH